MIGAYGVLSTDRALPTDALDGWALTDADGRHADGGVAIAAKTRNERSSHRSTVAGDGRIRCWVIGDVYGFNENADGDARSYESRPAGIDDARYCASLYDRYGIEFVHGLNGNFTLILYDRSQRQVMLCSDRLATVPIYLRGRTTRRSSSQRTSRTSPTTRGSTPCSTRATSTSTSRSGTRSA